MDWFLLYLMTRTEDVGRGLGILGAMGIIFGCIGWGFSLMGKHDEYSNKEMANAFLVPCRRLTIGGIIAVAISGLLPSRADWYTIIGGYYVTHVDGISDIPPNVVGAINRFLEDYSEHDKPEQKGDKSI